MINDSVFINECLILKHQVVIDDCCNRYLSHGKVYRGHLAVASKTNSDSLVHR